MFDSQTSEVEGQQMAPQVRSQPPNGPNLLQNHRSYENQLSWRPEVASAVNSQPWTGQYPQHGHEGQLVREQLMMPQIPFQPRSSQKIHHDQRWFEEEEVLQRFREGHDHESQARTKDRETQFRREEPQLSQPFWAQIQDHKDQQRNEKQELQRSQGMLAQLEEQMEQRRLEQQRHEIILSLVTRFVRQRSDQALQHHQSPHDAHKFNAASSQVYFQQQPDQHRRQITYQGTQRGDQDRRQNEGQPLQMGSSHPEGRKRKGQPSDDGVASLQRNNDRSPLPPTRDYQPLAWAHLQDEEPNFDSLPQQTAYGHPDHQGQQSSRVAAPVPSSPPGMDVDSMSVWEFLPQQTAYGHPDHQGQQSMYSCQPQQAAYGQQPIRYSTPPGTQSRAAAPIPSNPPGMDFDSMSLWDLKLWNAAFELPTERSRDNLIKQAKTGEGIKVVKRSRRSQKNRNLEGLTAGYAVGTQWETGPWAANKHCSTCSCTQPFSAFPPYDPPSFPNKPLFRTSQTRRRHENSPRRPNPRRSKQTDIADTRRSRDSDDARPSTRDA